MGGLLLQIRLPAKSYSVSTVNTKCIVNEQSYNFVNLLCISVVASSLELGPLLPTEQ